MYIEGYSKVFFIDRNNDVFHTSGLSFFSSQSYPSHLKDTLVDGEMVMDVVEGKLCPRFLIYDIISLEGSSNMLKDFRTRYLSIQVRSINVNWYTNLRIK